MTNVTMSKEGNVLTIKVDLSQDNGVSSTGKSHIIGSTSGFQQVPNADNGVKVNLTVIKKV